MDLERMERALRNAHRAGDEAAARKIASAIKEARTAPQQATGTEPTEQPQQPYDRGAFSAATEGAQSGLMFGFDDEIYAGATAPIRAIGDWWKGDGYDVGRAYSQMQEQLDAQKSARREQHPVASIAGEVAGGLAGGGTLAKGGLTLAGRNIPMLSQASPRAASVVGAGAEGAAYGGLYGAGEAKPGERLSGAATGAAIGAGSGAALQGIGNAIATRGARKAAQQAAPASDELKDVAQGLYRQSEAQGVTITQPAVKRLGGNLKAVAGRVNDRLRPKTAGFMDDIDAMSSGNMTLEAFDEFRKSLGKELARATPDDARTLGAMKRMADNFADNLQPGDFTGDAKTAVDFLKQARENWARASKAQTVERILDVADVDGAGKYTQAGFANAVKNEMKKLYKQIQKGKAQGWSKEEVALIRQMAMGGSNSRLVNLFAKFAPRGVFSIAGGQLIGSGIPGVGNVLVPLAGHVAGQAADRGAMAAAQALRAGAATGAPPYVLPQVTRKAAPFIGAGSAGSTEALRLLTGS